MAQSHGSSWTPAGDGYPVLLLSPHLDDAIFSAAAVTQAGPVTVWTVFAGEPDPPVATGWDASCGFRDSAETLRARRAEDEAAFSGTGAELRHLPFLDGPYTDPVRRTADLRAFRVELGTWLDEHPGATLVAPAGAGTRVAPAAWDRLRRDRFPTATPGPAPATPTPTAAPARVAAGPAAADQSAEPARPRGGNPVLGLVRRLMHADYRRRRAAALRRGLAANPDHLAVRDAALDAARERPGVRVVLYEELPYLWSTAADDAVAELARGRDLVAELIEVPVDAEDKFDRCQAYASQLDVMDPRGRLSTLGQLPSTERYWLLTRRDVP